MKKKSLLPSARVVVATLATGLVALAMLDITASLPSSVHDAATWIQFVPSLLSFLTAPALVATGFAVVLIVTLLFGRIYCSWICPLGYFQDVVIALRRFSRRKKSRFVYALPWSWVRHIGLGIVLTSAIAGLMIPLALLDPFSVFGRMMVHLAHPALAATNNLLSDALSASGFYWLKPRTVPGFDATSFAVGLIITVSVVVMALRNGRLWCNTFCPVGTLLGLISRRSLLRITLDESLCTSCGLCAMSCKAQCIDAKARRVDFDRCVGCMNCLNSCSQGGVKFTLITTTQPTTTLSDSGKQPGRRAILRGLAVLPLAALVAKAKAATDVFSLRKALKPNQRDHFVSPPGSVSADRFNSVCTACHLCVSACPTRVLQPSFTEYGLRGFLQPFMDFHSNFCNYECTRCGEVCPTGAIMPLVAEAKKRVQTGVAVFVKENCVVYTDETACGACSEHCPTKAVHMVEYKPGLLIPEVAADICVGCGACEYACPTLPNRAIFVNGHAVHQVASEPLKADESKEEVPEEFPF